LFRAEMGHGTTTSGQSTSRHFSPIDIDVRMGAGYYRAVKEGSEEIRKLRVLLASRQGPRKSVRSNVFRERTRPFCPPYTTTYHSSRGAGRGAKAILATLGQKSSGQEVAHLQGRLEK
jgi:hypothetical protein